MSLGLRPRPIALLLRLVCDRKFVMTIGAGIVDGLLLCFGKLTSGDYVTITLGTVGVYIGAAAWEASKTGKPSND